MNIQMTPADEHKRRLFIITITPGDVNKILTAGGLIDREPETMFSFQITNSGGDHQYFEKNEATFKQTDFDWFIFECPGGFETDKIHLDWLVKLGRINVARRSSSDEISFVQFKAA